MNFGQKNCRNFGFLGLFQLIGQTNNYPSNYYHF